MNTKLKAVIIGGAMLVGLSGTAAARSDVSFSIGLGVPAYTPYVAPAPVYYGYGYAPPAVYYAPPVRAYYAPARPYYGPHYGHRHYRGW